MINLSVTDRSGQSGSRERGTRQKSQKVSQGIFVFVFFIFRKVRMNGDGEQTEKARGRPGDLWSPSMGEIGRIQ